MLQLTELENGNLQLTIVDREEFLELLEKEFTDERHYLWDMLESGRYIGNDWDAPCNIGLTEMPVITFGSLYENDEAEQPNDYEKVWGYPNYMITAYLDELKEKGTVIFDKMN